MLNIITKFISLVSLLTNFVYSQTPCQIVVPAFPLTYNGLITPYQLLPPCDMKIAPSFAEAVILDLDTNSLSVYHPLIVKIGRAHV